MEWGSWGLSGEDLRTELVNSSAGFTLTGSMTDFSAPLNETLTSKLEGHGMCACVCVHVANMSLQL